MNNEPVAWMYAVNGIWTAFSDELPPDDAYDEGTLTPLYLHPHSEESVKAKTLTDEEIDRAIDETYGVPREPAIYAMGRQLAREILRKAQE